MARRSNELFIGIEHLNIEGRSIKHPALIAKYANVNVNKLSSEPVKLFGLDLETNAETAELKLLGFWDNNKGYSYYTKDFLTTLFMWIKFAYYEDANIAYWNRLDPFVLYKQFLKVIPVEDRKTSLERFGKIGGEWNRKEMKWDIHPVVEVQFDDMYFGIKNVIRSSIQFFFYRAGDEKPKTVWAYDIAQLYEKDIKTEALGKRDDKTGLYPDARLPYYSKIDESAHIVDWERFNNDEDYRVNIVLKSNELDAHAVYDLGMIIQEEFKKAFGWYSKTLVSQGSLARTAVVASIKEKYLDMYPDNEEKANYETHNDIKSIGFKYYYDTWLTQYGEDILKDLYALSTEAYSGGYIEAIRYGYSKDAYYADLASAYPAVIKDLWDLRNSKITTGKGEPPHIDYSYCFIRGTVNIPQHVNFHPLTVKHPINKDTNIRAVGEYIASYTIDERDFLIAQGATFSNETWYNIETEGKPHVLASVVTQFIDLRKELLAIGDTAQYMAKIAVNSIYGITYEAVDTYTEDNDLNVFRAGYRAGEYFNPIIATYITARTRVTMAKACVHIEKQGGKIILIMTDSVTWEGKAEMLHPDMFRSIKTVGYFEEPTHIKDMLCLGSGRYGFTSFNKKTGKWEHLISKKRGLNAVDIHDENGVDITYFTWANSLKAMRESDNDKMKILVRTLISVGLITNSLKYSIDDLGRIIEEYREVDPIVGKSKRFYTENIEARRLATGLIDTEPISLGYGMFGTAEYNDQSLPKLRELMFLKHCVSAKDKDTKNRRKASNKYRVKNKKVINTNAKEVYNQLRELGYRPAEAKKMRYWGLDTLNEKLMEDNKI